MDYIETPKEEYKKRFDLVIKEIDKKMSSNSIMYNYASDYTSKYVYIKKIYGLSSPDFTQKEIQVLFSVVYPDYYKWITKKTMRYFAYSHYYFGSTRLFKNSHNMGICHPLVFRLWNKLQVSSLPYERFVYDFADALHYKAKCDLGLYSDKPDVIKMINTINRCDIV